MGKRDIALFFYNKKGLEIAKTLIILILVILSLLAIYFAISNAAEKIFG